MPTFLRALAVTLLAAGFTVAADDKAPPAVGDEAKEFELPTLGSPDKTKLSALTAKGKVVLVVLRGYPGYQCPICSKQFAEFLAKADDFKAAGVQVAFVYPGPSDQLADRAAEFLKAKEYPDHFRVLLDPDYTFTNAYHLRWDAKNETAYPATFVLDAGRKVMSAKVSKVHGDRLSAADALAAAKK